ncbi:homoserine kinase [Micrococcus sp. ACRRV]|uniref:homoserine kinase n=1 Tax=Micrococcus sp. ACRRV TaxID=2918203 RepID=UPI001EF3418D|nr:homoserine kinase [Micrococcus sp. ACRRV]MCG7422186.1 homoserine kinase [Micrococcus sp. ACRRV]
MRELRDLPPGTGARVLAPATSANLGPGFDALGLALELRDEVTLTVVDGPDTAVVTGEGAAELPTDGEHLVLRLAHAHLTRRRFRAPGLALTAVNRIPHARGLGSSAAAVVTAVLAAEALLPADERLSAAELLDVTARREGHPDNVAPALAGGASVSWHRDGGPGWATAAVALHPQITPVIGIPDVTLSTHAARAALPESVPHAVAAEQAGRAALLTLALASRPDLLLPATRDWLHQDARASAMPPSAALVRGLREQGHAAVVSGAGPTVLVLAPTPADAERAAEAMRALAPETGAAWRVLVPGVAAEGARVEPLHHG